MKQLEKDQIDANDKLSNSQRERTNLERRIKELQKQQAQRQEQLAKQRNIAAEAEEMNRKLQKSQKHHEDIAKNLQACRKDLEDQLKEEQVARQRLELEKISSEMKWNHLQKDFLLQVNAKSRKTQQERENLEQRLSELKTSLSGAERRNAELHLALDNKSKDNEELTNENEKLTNDLKAVTLSQSEADGKTTRLKELLQGTKTRLQEALIEIYREDPRISHDDRVLSSQTTIEDFDPLHPVGERETILRGGPTFEPVKYVKEVCHVKHIHADSL